LKNNSPELGDLCITKYEVRIEVLYQIKKKYRRLTTENHEREENK